MYNLCFLLQITINLGYVKHKRKNMLHTKKIFPSNKTIFAYVNVLNTPTMNKHKNINRYEF